MLETGLKYLIAFVLLALVVAPLTYFVATPQGRAAWNNYWHDVEKADVNTSFESRKKVEDTCRSMIASYNSDVLTYQQYKDYDTDEQRSWAAQAKMRANKTASSYNNYILVNSYIWEGNVPDDIKQRLDVVE